MILSNCFIEVVREYAIFHDRDLKWSKIDTIQARARFKQIKCPWEIFCSWFEVTRSSQIKTFLEEYIWGRVFKKTIEVDM